MLTTIRHFLTEQQIDALLIPRTDSFLGEHYPPEKDTLQRATGFTGSAGMALITPDKAVLFVDARYTDQARLQAPDFTVFEIPTDTTPSKWMTENLPHQTIGYPAHQRSVAWVYQMFKALSPADIRFTGINKSKWETLLPPTPVRGRPDPFDYPIEFAGESSDDKIARVADIVRNKGVDAVWVGTPDNVSWLLNKRCLWAPCYPAVFEQGFVTADGHYCPLTPDTLTALSDKTIAVDLSTMSQETYEHLRTHAITLQDTPDMIAPLKAVKNQTEQQNIRTACLFESVVVSRFLAWIEMYRDTIDECACDTKLKELRAASPLYRGDSFDTIAAVGEHAARAHYQATPDSTVPVTSAPLLLVDTGGHYLNGTTDMTRTIATGTPTSLMKHRYTQVLKGHIALATSTLKEGDSPALLDQRAHSFLRADGVDYRHATGHGIGLFLDVHEAPPVIHESVTTPLLPGMLFSNEPAYYDNIDGFGIRLENMILAQTGADKTITLENLLWIPFDGRLIDETMLTPAEKKWLCDYHATIRNRILPLMPPDEQQALFPLLDFFDHLG